MRVLIGRLATVATLTLSVSPALADLTGRASVIDGDTIEIHGQRVRLFGIDTPESGQTRNDATGMSYSVAL